MESNEDIRVVEPRNEENASKAITARQSNYRLLKGKKDQATIFETQCHPKENAANKLEILPSEGMYEYIVFHSPCSQNPAELKALAQFPKHHLAF